MNRWAKDRIKYKFVDTRYDECKLGDTVIFVDGEMITVGEKIKIGSYNFREKNTGKEWCIDPYCLIIKIEVIEK